MSRQPIISCPNCQAVWGFDEIEEESCFACGYPDNEDDDDDDDNLYGSSDEIDDDDTPSLQEPLIPIP